MYSPKSRQHKEKKQSYRRREHKNKKFYNSKAWKQTRAAYLKHYERKLFNHIPLGNWENMTLDGHQVSYILSLGFQPCEICLKLYCADAYDKVEKGVELDHIIPVNPGNALLPFMENEFGVLVGCGDPFSFDNLQLLCKRHHAKKSQRER